MNARVVPDPLEPDDHFFDVLFRFDSIGLTELFILLSDNLLRIADRICGGDDNADVIVIVGKSGESIYAGTVFNSLRVLLDRRTTHVRIHVLLIPKAWREILRY